MNKQYLVEDLTENEVSCIEGKLIEYDQNHITYQLEGSISLGVKDKGHVIAGLDACMTVFHILYVSTVFVDLEYRRTGIGSLLMEELEIRARQLGANTIRLDSFDFQGREFYINLGYEEVGFYKNEIDGYSESFFLKRL